MGRYACRFLACLALSVCLLSLPGCRRSGEGFTLDVLSTGKSDCILIRMDGSVILCDTAYADSFATIQTALDGYGITKIDLLILTHYDKDHIGSAAQILFNYDVKLVVGPDYTESSDEYRALSDAVSETGVPWKILHEDYTLTSGGGSLTIEPPQKDSYSDDNNYSLITAVTYDGYSFLLMGDALKDRVSEFLGQSQDHYTLVKLPHHGTCDKALESLLEQDAPDYAVLTVSADTKIDKDLTDLLDQLDTTLYKTCDGAVHAAISGDSLSIRIGN